MRQHSPGIVRLISAAVMAAATMHGQAQAPVDPFAKCSEQFAKTPDDYDAAYCFYEVTQQRGLWSEGSRIFEALIESHPGNFWLPLAYGHVYRSRDPERAEALYRQAADGFRGSKHVEGEILARSNLRNFLFPKGRVQEATREMARVAELGAASDDPLLKARAWTLEATHVQDSGGDLSRAYHLLKRTESAIFPDGPYRLQRSTLNSLGLVAFRLGRLEEALRVFQALDALAAAEGEKLAQSNAQYNILNTFGLKESILPSPQARTRLMQLARRSLETAMAAQNRDMTLKTHRALAELLGKERGAAAAALQHVEACLDLAMQLRQPHDEAVCSWVQASLLRSSSPDAARAAELRALQATDRANSPRTHAYSAQRRMRLSWDTKPRAEAVQDAMAALGSIETLRSLQNDADASAELFSTWTADYYWLSGHLLQSSEAGDLDRAFLVTERMRARSLLDSLERSRARPDPKHPAVVRRRGLLESIAGTQRKLMDPTLSRDERRASLAALQDLELREREARQQVDQAFPTARSSAPAFATLGDVQGALQGDEALLAFQVGLRETYDGEFAGGSWLVAVTKQHTAVYRVPDRAALAPMVPVFAGLLRSPAGPAGVEAASASRLYAELLAPALAALPATVTKLIVVPDGPLHHVPFEALRAAPDAPVLGAQYEITVAPSSTLWRHWRLSSRHPTGRALAFADPAIHGARTADAQERNAALERGLLSGRLPFSRRESRSLRQHFGNVETLAGARASEKALKDRDLAGYDVVHFAVHAIADEAHPERSAVLLAPGASTEDGLLQSREIQELNLDGRIVVLSACQTAAGTVLSGEGVLSLARAFFAAGAHAVIGTRWPIRDEDAAWLFDVFYRRLGEGASLSEALKGAKARAIESGRPAAAWASLVLLGNGAFQPFPGGRPHLPQVPPSSGHRLRLALALAGGVALGAALWRRGRKSAPLI